MKIMNIIFPVIILIMGYTHLAFANQQFNITNSKSKTSENVAIVEGFFQSFIDGTYQQYIYDNFDPLVEYRVVQDDTKLFGPEREGVLTHTGLYEGPDGANYFFDQTGMERDVVSFDVHEVFGRGDSVAAFGSFRYRAPLGRGGSGNLGETEWATRIIMKDKKFFRYTFMEDSYAVAAFYRRAEEGTKFRREFDGKIRDILTGTNSSESISPINSAHSNIIFGYGGDDIIAGGDTDDMLYGGIGENTLTGNGGADLFAIGEGAEGTPVNRHDGASDFTVDTITDFTKGEDIIGLTFGLPFEELQFTQDGSDIKISINDSDQLLAILKGVGNIILEMSDFITFPPATPITQVVPPGPGLPDGYFVREDPFGDPPANPGMNEKANVRIVKLFLLNFLRNDHWPVLFIDTTIHPDVKFTVSGTGTDLFGAERKAVLPYTGLYEGRDGVKTFFKTLGADREVIDFNIEEVYSSGSSVAAFGTYTYRSSLKTGGSGDVLGCEWAVRIWMAKKNGKPLIYRLYFFEDTMAVANGYRHKFQGSLNTEWTREFGGQDQTLLAATDAPETLTGKDLPSKITGKPLANRIFGYGGNDTLIGQKGNDFLYGGKGNDTLNGGDGHDDLYGNEGDDTLLGANGDDNLYGNRGNDTMTGNDGADIFVLGTCDGSDIVTDFIDGQDKIGLLGDLTFKRLKLTQKGNDVEIRTSQKKSGVLAILKGVSVSNITENDFTRRSDSGAVINPRRDLLDFPEFGFGPDYPIFDHPLIDLTTGFDQGWKCQK